MHIPKFINFPNRYGLDRLVNLFLNKITMWHVFELDRVKTQLNRHRYRLGSGQNSRHSVLAFISIQLAT